MSRISRARAKFITTLIIVTVICVPLFVFAASSTFHNAPESAAAMKNPYSDNQSAIAGGKKLYGQNCAQCHGNNLQGMGPAPALESDKVKKAKPGELFWFITNGDLNKGMPSWSSLPKQQRWQIVSFLESRNKSE